MKTRNRNALVKRIRKAQAAWLASLEEQKDAWEELIICVEDGEFSDAQFNVNMLDDVTVPSQFLSQKDRDKIEICAIVEDAA